MFNILSYKQASIKFIDQAVDQFKSGFNFIKINLLHINKLKWPINRAIIIKLIGKITALFNNLIKKKPEETIPEGFLGITINNGIIALVHLVVNNQNQVIVKSYNVTEVSSINNGANKNLNPIQNLIAKYIQDHKLQRIASAYVLADQQYVLSPIELPPKGDNGLKEKAILLGVKDYINYPIEDALLESFEISIPRSQDNARLAYAVVMRAKLSEEIASLVNGAEAELRYIDINELSLRNITLLYEELQKDCLLLKLSELNSNILLIKNKELLVIRNTKLAVKKLDLFDPNNKQEEQINIADNLILEIQRSLDYAHNLFRELHFSSINILPCDINLDLFIPWAAEQLGLPINKINLTDKIIFEQTMSVKEQAQCLSAIGGTLRILEQ